MTDAEHPTDRDPATVAWALVAMSRPDQLALIALVYALGATIALARGVALAPTDLLAGGVAVLLTAASVHYANEYADYETDARTTRTPFSGGSGALQRTGLPRRLALRAAGVTLVVGLGLAALCLLHGFAAPAVAVLAGIAVLGWQYSLPPLALAWRGIGELDNAALGGLALPAYGYAVQAGRVPPAVVAACLPFASLVFVNLLHTTWPDRRADAAVGKRTLATRWSRRRLRTAYALGALAWLGSSLALWGRVLPPVVAAGSLAVAPLVAWGWATYTRRRSPFPTVAAMVALAAIQLVTWAAVAGIGPLPRP